MRLEIEGTNPTVIEHQFIDKLQKTRSRAWEDIVTITITGTPVVGDVIRAGTIPLLTITAANISDIPTALAFELNEGSFYSNYGLISSGYRFCPVSYPFVVSGSTITARGDESYTVPGFGLIPTGYPCQPAAMNVVNQSGSTLVAALSFVVDTPAPYFDENVQALWIGYDLYTGTGTYQFDYGSISVPYTRPSPATIPNLLAARDDYIAAIIAGIEANELVDCGIVITQQNNWILFTTPDHTDTVLTHQPFAPRIGNPDSAGTISVLNFRNTGFGSTGAGACCHAMLTSKPFKRGIADPWGSGSTPETYDITDKFCHEEWIHSFERTETFTEGRIYSSILGSDPCPDTGQTFNDPCTFVDPQVQSLFYSHRIRRYIDLAQITMCLVDVSGVPSLQVRLRIEARWRVSKKILTTLDGGYNTTPLGSLAYDATATESGTGFTHEVFSDVFDKTITIPADCPMPDFVFTPTTSDHVETLLYLGATRSYPECCNTLISFSEDLYQPMVYAPVTLKFINCEGFIEEEVP